ncbi:hypothetical protein OPKNFCMD_0768 [Methylobacterium crusticola]|uniref:Peroxidase n=1 Tax=Methylobacterium crusticola TaxID=1697972 RepID=A0ABQ4QRV1_9HYPH|nr:heme peroxidase family protein [Methylobacterium crusticola]GJD48053.1 hypothetical protein OPKNFCMD_0768 [Methylobacterium crusticola]
MAQHGTDNRGIEAGASPGFGYGRFGRMFELDPATRMPVEALQDIAGAMIREDAGAPITEAEDVDENPAIPAGYTYFGQFVDHDITFDPTPLNGSEIDVRALEDFRTPALDLDSLYGSGPDDQPYLYKGLALRLGPDPGNAGARIGARADLQRLPEDQIALIGDKRNDENKIVSQIHSGLIAFHNKVVADDSLIAKVGGDPGRATSRFRAAATITRWHYQWVVVFDYLARVLMPGVLERVLNRRGFMPNLQYYAKPGLRFGYMPVEFAGAAFRFGHSMVRPSYALNVAIGTDPAGRIPTFSRGRNFENMNGFPGPLPTNWGIDWGYFLEGIKATVPEANGPADRGPGASVPTFQVPQRSYRIDALLAQPLGDLPEFRTEEDHWVRNLAFRNLDRGQMLGLPSGERVARAIGARPVPPDQVWKAGSRLLDRSRLPGDTAGDLDATLAARGAVAGKWAGAHGPLHASTPLWYYVLREAEYFGVEHRPQDPCIGFGGQHLGPVGSRILAETFVGLLWYDRSSFLHRMPEFRPFPEIAGTAPHFTLDRLLAYALG